MYMHRYRHKGFLENWAILMVHSYGDSLLLCKKWIVFLPFKEIMRRSHLLKF